MTTNQEILQRAREQHQARSQRVYTAFFGTRDAHSEEGVNYLTNIWEWAPEAIADAFAELATIWREEATEIMTPDSKGALRRGAKGTADSLRGCATRLMGFAEALKKHGLPPTMTAVLDPRGSFVTPEEFTSGPKVITAGASALASGAQAAVLPAVGDQQAQPLAESSVSEKLSDPFPPNTTPIAADPAGDFLRDLGRMPNSTGDWTKLDEIARQGLDGSLPREEETLEQAGAAIVAQVQEKRALVTAVPMGEVFMNSNGILDTSVPAPLTVTWSDNGGTDAAVLPNGMAIGSQPLPGDPASWTVSAAPPPPAWTLLPEVPVMALEDSPDTWLPSPDHTSPSQANLAGKCGLRWWLRYRRGAQERPGWSAVGGTAVHGCVEAIENSELAPVTSIEVRPLWTEMFGRAIARTQAENPDYPIETWSAAKSGKEDRAWWELDGPEMVHRYLEWRADWAARGWELARTKDGRPAVEVECLVTLKGVPKPVKMVIDQVWCHRATGRLAIVDLKSGASAQPDYFQLATYALALTTVLAEEYHQYVGTSPTGAFWDARSGQLGPLVRLIDRHPDAEVVMRLAAPARMDAAGIYIPNVEGGYGGCNSCPLKRACPVGSRAGKGE